MLGAIIGDVIGSSYEGIKTKSKDFELFTEYTTYTDDSIMTLAVLETLLDNYPIKYDEKSLLKLEKSLVDNFVKFYHIYDFISYGPLFEIFLKGKKHLPYNSYGNGSSMRISPVSYFARTLKEVKLLSYHISRVSHNHIEGIKGAEALAVAIFLARHKVSKKTIKNYITKHYYPRLLSITYEDLLANYQNDVSCQGSVPEAIYCFLISTDFLDCLKTAISIGGDVDTITSMSLALAEAYYQDIPKFLKELVLEYLDVDMLDLLERFDNLWNSSLNIKKKTNI